MIVFGSVVAGAVPGLVGGTAVALTLALMVILGQVFELSIFSLNLATMLGLGLGIDYSLFIVSRFREELARGESVERAVAWSVATAGRAVVFSGATVMIGLLALLTFDITALRSMGLAGALVVAISVVAALSLLPALLGVLGTRIDALAIGPLVSSAARAASGTGFWSRLAYGVMARPLAVLVPLLVLLIGLPTAMYAQNTDDDVHIKPRMEPKPPSDGTKELEKDFSPHTRPLKSTVGLVLGSPDFQRR